MSDFTVPLSVEAIRGRLETSFPILIADHASPSLAHELRKDFPDLSFDFCESHDQEKERLRNKRYQACVLDVRFAGNHDFSLIRQSLSDQPDTPCLITVTAAEKASAYQAIIQGAFDSILKPLKILQAVPTLQRALWLFRFRETVAEKKKSLAMFKAHRDSLLMNHSGKGVLDKRIVQAEDALASCERAYQEADFAQQARQRALKRLDNL